MAPNPSPRPVAAWRLWKRFWDIARAQRRWLLLGLSMIPGVAALATLRPLLVKEAVDVHLQNGDILGLRVVAAFFMVAVVGEFLCQGVQTYALQKAGSTTIADTRRQLFAHIMRLPARYYDRHAVGSLLSRTTSDVEALGETLAAGVFTIITDAVLIVSIVGAMFWLSPLLAGVTLLLAPALVLIVQVFGARLRKLQLEIRKAQAVQSGYLAERLGGVALVQLYGQEQPSVDAFDEQGRRYLKATQHANIYDALLFSLMEGISAMAIAVLIYVGANALGAEGTAGTLSLGLLFAFVDYLQRVFIPIRDFSSKLATTQRATASLERIFQIFDTAPEPGGDEDPLEGWRGGLRMRNLRFRYSDDGPEVLRGVDLDVAPGEVLAIVGRTGSGKSTIGRLLTRLYEGYEGSIELTDVNGASQAVALNSVPPKALRRRLLMLPQDAFMFDGDMALNVGLGAPELAGDPDVVREALAAVSADFVSARGGVEMQVSERGANLSVGELQLVALARVAARRPTLLVLDEATANVDSETEQRVQTAIERLLSGRSVIVIAHRLSTVRRADRIAVMQDGAVAEMGTHEELLSRGGLYAELYRSGFSEEPAAAGARPASGRAEAHSGT